jgi:L-alanine-DL-glutamate epimerase-like enolase superfamily enzyme
MRKWEGTLKITKIETFLVNVGHRNLPFVKVHTDEELYGVGEAYSCGPDKATVEVIRDFESWLVGRDPCDVAALHQLMVLGSRFPAGVIVSAAISGIEHALCPYIACWVANAGIRFGCMAGYVGRRRPNWSSTHGWCWTNMVSVR